MQKRQVYDTFTYAWTHGEPIHEWLGQQGDWALPVPDELFLTADEIEEARPWHAMTLEGQMAHMTVDPRQ